MFGENVRKPQRGFFGLTVNTVYKRSEYHDSRCPKLTVTLTTVHLYQLMQQQQHYRLCTTVPLPPTDNTAQHQLLVIQANEDFNKNPYHVLVLYYRIYSRISCSRV